MKKNASLVIGILLTLTVSAQTPVYLYLASHNETNDQVYHGLNYGNAAHYASIRGVVKSLCDTVVSLDAAYVMMVESNIINANLAHEAAAVNETDLLQWADEQSQIDVEPHNHFVPLPGPAYNPYNYADLAYLLDSCGLAYPRRVMGGFIWRNFNSPAVSQDWTQWQTPQPGHTYPHYSWQPQIIWGGGSPGHINDYEAFGIWRPSAPTIAGFGMHNPGQPLVCLGGGCNDGFVLWDTTTVDLLSNRVINLIQEMKSRNWPQDTFFSIKVMMNFRHFMSPGYVSKVAALIRNLEPYREAGDFEWKTINEIYAAWQEAHPSAADYFIVSCDSMHISSAEPVVTGLQGHSNAYFTPLRVYPNPVSTMLYIDSELSGVGEVLITDARGIFRWRQRIQAHDSTVNVDVNNWSPGLYFVFIQNEKEVRQGRFIKGQ